MGQAKARGSFEVRKTQAIERARLESIRRAEEFQRAEQRRREALFAQAKAEGIPPVLVAGTGTIWDRQRAVRMAVLASSLAPLILIDRTDALARRRYR
jgi:hypothetical protein